jgi:hypothetical protein
MRRILAAALIFGGFCVAAWGKDRKLPSGEAGNEAVGVEALCLDAAELKEIFGTDFDNLFSVVEVTLTPKGGKPLDIHLDDFLMRSEQTGAHSGPLYASQIAGQDTLVVHQSDVNKRKSGPSFGGGMGPIMMGGGGSSAPPPEARVEVKNSEKRDPMLDVLKRKILAEKPAGETVTGLLFFPLDKEKPKNLVLIYTVPGPEADKLRIRFK